MHRVVQVKALEGYRLEVAFDDGTRGIVGLEDRLFGSMFEPLRDPRMFHQVFIDEFGVVAWPKGADLAPDALYEKLRSASPAA
jgi:hypothetical protein